MFTYLTVLAVVLTLAAGQILFKLSANALRLAGTLFAFKPLALLAAALAIYGLASLAWVLVLQRVQLGQAYPLMALSFALVPLASYFVFGERFTPAYALGVGLIMLGIVISVRG